MGEFRLAVTQPIFEHNFLGLMLTIVIQGKRVFIKDMAYYLFPAPGEKAQIAASLGGGEEPNNPTVIPFDMLKQFHFTFLIRHPRRSVPSYWRCCIPPLREVSGFDYFLPSEMGYEELVKFLDWAIERGLVDKDRLTVVDADDLLDNPEAMIRKYCERTGLVFDPSMLKWNDADQEHAKKLFAKWNGFHDDALSNRELKGRTHAQKTLTVEAENQDWEAKYGKEAQKIIRETVDANIPLYEYLKQYCIKV
ncbi:hypothetical protein MGU_03909 [Metarhizium guizhouense ARSEF 977]|uniref:Sulfotransferase family protein n=1 Tax=Metarhizium guizhouense (strain ARSEF 977) TaxID=1276136 RepID=A0A0B4I7M6_METGA|nr:hypothetical protein MGU_03909 [Metarhizium guizhouense ARSEF 977]